MTVVKAALVAALFLIASLAGAHAQIPETTLPTHGCNRPDLSPQIAAVLCRSLMESGTVTPRFLAVLLQNRGQQELRTAMLFSYEQAMSHKTASEFRNMAAKQAIGYFDKALGIDPDLPNAYLWRGWAHLLRGYYADAIVDFDALKPYSTRSPTPYQSRALAKLLAGLNEAAVQESDECLKRHRQSADCLFFRGLARHRHGDPGSEDDLKAASAINPKAVALYEKQFGLKP